MNILLISPYFAPMVGGVETHLTDLVKYFESQKHTVYVRTYQALGTTAKGKKEEHSRYVYIHRLNWPNFNLLFHFEPYPVLKFIYLFTGLFLDCFWFICKHRDKIDVIQVHGFVAAAIGVVLKKIFGTRVVVNTHVGFKFNSSGIMTDVLKTVLKQADQILVLTYGAKESLMEIGVPESRIAIYHYWVDQKVFSPGSKTRQELGWSKDFIVLFVGRLLAVKGVYILLELVKKLPQITFVIAGSGPLTRELSALQISNLKFIGKVANEDLTPYYRSADVLIIPSQIISQTYEEGIPRVMIEALFCGLPIIATKSGGIPDVFDPSIGQLVEDNVLSMQKVIQTYYKTPKLLQKLSKNCRSFAIKLFNVNNAKIIEKSLK